jgi:hypothetical protein
VGRGFEYIVDAALLGSNRLLTIHYDKQLLARKAPK